MDECDQFDRRTISSDIFFFIWVKLAKKHDGGRTMTKFQDKLIDDEYQVDVEL